MALRNLVAVIVKRWYVLLIGIACTFLTVGLFSSAPGVYSTQVDVVFLPPTYPQRGNPLEGRSDSLIYFAAIIEREVNMAPNDVRSSGSTTLYGSGIRSGHQVILPDGGGQWQTSFGRQVLSVEVVDPSEEKVREMLDEQLARIRETVQKIQDDQGVVPRDQIRTALAPPEPVVTYVGGSPTRAAIGILLLGLTVSFLMTVIVDRLLARFVPPLALTSANSDFVCQ